MWILCGNLRTCAVVGGRLSLHWVFRVIKVVNMFPVRHIVDAPQAAPEMHSVFDSAAGVCLRQLVPFVPSGVPPFPEWDAMPSTQRHSCCRPTSFQVAVEESTLLSSVVLSADVGGFFLFRLAAAILKGSECKPAPTSANMLVNEEFTRTEVTLHRSVCNLLSAIADGGCVCFATGLLTRLAWDWGAHLFAWSAFPRVAVARAYHTSFQPLERRPRLRTCLATVEERAPQVRSSGRHLACGRNLTRVWMFGPQGLGHTTVSLHVRQSVTHFVPSHPQVLSPFPPPSSLPLTRPFPSRTAGHPLGVDRACRVESRAPHCMLTETSFSDIPCCRQKTMHDGSSNTLCFFFCGFAMCVLAKVWSTSPRHPSSSRELFFVRVLLALRPLN